jgi:hypothetical protein
VGGWPTRTILTNGEVRTRSDQILNYDGRESAPLAVSQAHTDSWGEGVCLEGVSEGDG